MTEVRGQRSDDRGQRADDGGRMVEDRKQMTDVRCQKTEDRYQRPEAGGQQRTNERMHVARRAVPLRSEICSKSSGRIAVEKHLG